MSELVPESERERRYDKWYELEKLHREAIRRRVDPKEIAATKVLVDEAWAQYVDVVTNNLTGTFDGYENPKGPR